MNIIYIFSIIIPDSLNDSIGYISWFLMILSSIQIPINMNNIEYQYFEQLVKLGFLFISNINYTENIIGNGLNILRSILPYVIRKKKLKNFEKSLSFSKKMYFFAKNKN